MTEIAPGLKKYVEREGAADAPRPAPGSKVHVHFTATVRSSDRAIDSSRGEFTTQVGGITVRKCNMPLQLTLPKDRSGAVDAAEDADERANIRGLVLAIDYSIDSASERYVSRPARTRLRIPREGRRRRTGRGARFRRRTPRRRRPSTRRA